MAEQKQHRRTKRGNGKKNHDQLISSEMKLSIWDVIADAPDHNALPYITEKLADANVDLVCENKGDRCVFVCKNRNVRMTPLAQSCVGLIGTINEKKLTILSSMPSSPIKLNEKDLPRIFREFDDFKCLKMDDGTSIGLYYYDDTWVIRTINGYDVGRFTWNGVPTYQDVLNDVLDSYPDFKLENLNKYKCYTIGFKNTKFHPFLEGQHDPIVRAWFIQSVDI